MLAIVDALKARRYPPTLFAETLALFMSCLSNMSPTETLCRHHTGIVLKVFVGIRHVCSLNAKGDNMLMRILLESSPSFIGWARFFVTDAQVRRALPLQTTMNSLLMTLSWVYLHASEEEISQYSLNESDLFDLVVHIWLVDDSDYNAGHYDRLLSASLFNVYLTKAGV
ncbi:hypothetical protein DFH11DRAFT_869524 [Phellopilus nigrolimitatus]|nr:hypothetical protein DFH11DRAFT_869524 [Phellopilus nigrolimitatus]